MIAGKTARRFGEAKNSWLTGTAAWNFMALSQYIAGLKPSYDGLIVEPRLPSEIKKAELTRVFRGKTFHIFVENINNRLGNIPNKTSAIFYSNDSDLRERTTDARTKKPIKTGFVQEIINSNGDIVKYIVTRRKLTPNEYDANIKQRQGETLDTDVSNFVGTYNLKDSDNFYIFTM